VTAEPKRYRKLAFDDGTSSELFSQYHGVAEFVKTDNRVTMSVDGEVEGEYTVERALAGGAGEFLEYFAHRRDFTHRAGLSWANKVQRYVRTILSDTPSLITTPGETSQAGWDTGTWVVKVDQLAKQAIDSEDYSDVWKLFLYMTENKSTHSALQFAVRLEKQHISEANERQRESDGPQLYNRPYEEAIEYLIENNPGDYPADSEEVSNALMLLLRDSDRILLVTRDGSSADEPSAGDGTTYQQSRTWIKTPVVDNNCETFASQRESGPPMATLNYDYLSTPPGRPSDVSPEIWRDDHRRFGVEYSHVELSVPIFDAGPTTAHLEGLVNSIRTSYPSMLEGTVESLSGSLVTEVYNQVNSDWIELGITPNGSDYILAKRALDFANTSAPTNSSYFDLGSPGLDSEEVRRILADQPAILADQPAMECHNFASTLRQNIQVRELERSIRSATRARKTDIEMALDEIMGNPAPAEPLFYEVERHGGPEKPRVGIPSDDFPHLLLPRPGGNPLYYKNSTTESNFTFVDSFIEYGEEYNYNVYAYASRRISHYKLVEIPSKYVGYFTSEPQQVSTRRYYLMAYETTDTMDLLRLPYIHGDLRPTRREMI